MLRPLYANIGLPSSSSTPSRRNDANDTVVDEALARKLEMALNEVQPLLEDAERKQFTSNAVRSWLIELKCSIYDAESSLDFIRNVTLSNKEAPEEVPYDSSALDEFKQRIPVKAANIIATLSSLIDKSGCLGLVADTGGGGGVPPASLRTNRITTSLVEESDVFGRINEKEQIMGWVLSEEPSIPGTKIDMISIVGMGGVGKTTLAQLVYNDPKISSGDYLISWVYVSDTFDAARLTKEILASIWRRSYGDDCSWDVLQRELCEVLKGNKFLIVLDDVWDWDPRSMQVWDRFLKPFNCGAHGSKMVVTTRNDRVASALRSSHRLQLNELSEEHGWSLFSQSIFPTGQANAHPQLVAIGREIVSKCKGLPLAIKAAVGILRGLGEDAIQWKRVLESELWNVESVLPALAISYCYLPQHLKRCFSYCSLFPKGHRFPSLTKLWIDEGFEQLQNGVGCMQARSNDYLGELVSRSFLNRSRKGSHSYYSMHDLTHDLAVFVGEKIYKLFETETPITSRASIRHVSFKKISEVRFDGNVNFEDLSEVRSLTIGSPYQLDLCTPKEVLGEISCRLLFLRVLSLYGCRIGELPDTIGDLRLLRRLEVQSLNIKELPASLCNLSNLRCLNCRFCHRLQELPDRIGNLVSLRYLDVSHTAIKDLPASLCCLFKLEELDCSYCKRLQELPDRIGNLVSLRHLDVHSTAIKDLPASLCCLANLEELDCSYCRSLQELPDRIGNLVSLRHLHVSSTAIKELPASLCCLSNLEELVCSGCDHVRSLPDEMGKLVSLRQLNVSYTAIKELPASLCLLPTLEMLKCCAYECLEQLPDGIGDIVSLQYINFEGASLSFEGASDVEPTSLRDANRWEISDGAARRVNP